MSIHVRLIAHLIGVVLSLFFLTWLLPIGLAVFFREWSAFLVLSLFALLGLGLGLGLRSNDPSLMRKSLKKFHKRDAFMLTALLWVLIPLLASIPLYVYSRLHQELRLSFFSSLFEATSGLTTTGATAIFDVEAWPKSFLMYRSLLEWLGGIGIVVLSIAILPMLGVGGMQMFATEVAGPVKDEKIAPHVRETAKALWRVYFFLTLGCATLLWAFGMDVFDALAYSFSVVSTGGFTPHNNGLLHYDNFWMSLICCIFVILAATNFTLHFLVFQKKNPLLYLKNIEMRFFLIVLFLGSILVFFGLYASDYHGDKNSFFLMFFEGFFGITSTMTSAGILNGTVAKWPDAAIMILILWSFIGGASGSTSGGMKSIRIFTLFSQIGTEIQRLLHPNTIPASLAGGSGKERLLLSIMSFLGLYALTCSFLMAALMLTGLSLFDAWASTATMLNNMGVGFGVFSSNFSSASSSQSLIFDLGMILGRLEIFTLLIIFTPTFWRYR